KMINDPIHGLIELKKPLLLIVDTPEFQRLRFIKQLGLCHKVYPSAVHTRFEHCIGTSHLAGQLVRHLKECSKEHNITDMDVLCVEIAGLCHDLGHGPFSHAFETVMKKKGIEWKHELKSVEMLCHLIEKNSLQKDLENCGLQFPHHLILIASLIVAGPLSSATCKIYFWYKIEKEYKCKMFLFEIVANDLNCIDVDKFDYFARDAYYLGFNTGFEHQRYIQNARVCEFHGDFHICQPKKQWSNLLELFHVRERLHRNAYQHRVTKLIEHKVAEAIKEGYSKLIGDKVNSMESYSTLTDSIYETILHSDDEELCKAKDIIMGIERRNLPKFVGEITISQVDAFKK
uniref:HD/PDEase domain-containing protein n=1 Tax=Petromyzon marinus TaxID=7757 RepID=S4RUN5_PETMA